MVVALPSGSSASYQLRPPGGGVDGRARADGTTLRPVPVPVTHVTPMRRDAVYDTRAQQAALAVTVRYEDGAHANRCSSSPPRKSSCSTPSSDA